MKPRPWASITSSGRARAEGEGMSAPGLRGHLKMKGCYDRWRRLAKAPPRFQLCSSAHPMQYASGVKYLRSSWPVRSRGGSRRGNTIPDNKLPDSTSDIVSAAPPAARELLKLLPCQDRAFPPRLTASGRSLFAELPSPHGQLSRATH